MPHCVLIFIFPWLLRCCSEPVGFLSFSPCKCPFVRPPFLPFMPTMFVSGLEWQGVRAWQFGALFLHSWHFIEGFHGLLSESGPCAELLRGGVTPLRYWRVFWALAAAVSCLHFVQHCHIPLFVQLHFGILSCINSLCAVHHKGCHPSTSMCCCFELWFCLRPLRSLATLQSSSMYLHSDIPCELFLWLWERLLLSVSPALWLKW
jgi:hypothetical protein